MTTITELQKSIVKALESDTEEERQRKSAPLFKELAELRAKEAEEKERAELQKVVDAKQDIRDKAGAVMAKVKAQDDGINKFLELCQEVVSQLKPLVEQINELAEMQSIGRDGMGECYAGFFDIGQFSATVRQVKKGYLPESFGCPFIQLGTGNVDAWGQALQAQGYFMSALGILSNFNKVVIPANLSVAEGLMSLDEEPTEVESSCRVCSHRKATEINKALQEGRSLRDLETEWNVPRSTLSRHKNRCLNLGAIRVVEEG